MYTKFLSIETIVQKEVTHMQIRIAQETDLPALCKIYNYEVEHTTVTFDLNPKTVEERRGWFEAHNVENHPLIVAEVDGIVAGYACLSPYRHLEAYKETVELSVYVDRHFRGQGIARALMQTILDDARGREDIHSVISVITGDNEISIHLHEKFGFAYCGTMREMGCKFGKMLDIVNYQLLV